MKPFVAVVTMGFSELVLGRTNNSKSKSEMRGFFASLRMTSKNDGKSNGKSNGRNTFGHDHTKGNCYDNGGATPTAEPLVFAFDQVGGQGF